MTDCDVESPGTAVAVELSSGAAAFSEAGIAEVPVSALLLLPPQPAARTSARAPSDAKLEYFFLLDMTPSFWTLSRPGTFSRAHLFYRRGLRLIQTPRQESEAQRIRRLAAGYDSRIVSGIDPSFKWYVW
jgi:hypothetical protein